MQNQSWRPALAVEVVISWPSTSVRCATTWRRTRQPVGHVNCSCISLVGSQILSLSACWVCCIPTGASLAVSAKASCSSIPRQSSLFILSPSAELHLQLATSVGPCGRSSWWFPVEVKLLTAVWCSSSPAKEEKWSCSHGPAVKAAEVQPLPAQYSQQRPPVTQQGFQIANSTAILVAWRL